VPNLAVHRNKIASNYPALLPCIRRTPILEVQGKDFGVPLDKIVFKLEFLQHAGSFKARGAFTNLLRRQVPKAGVVAASGGNHGAAVAFAAMRLGIPAHIFVPTVCSQSKIDRIRGYGAKLVITGERYDDALKASIAWATDSGALQIHAYDQVETLIGQGSVGLELEKQAPELNTILVAVGGGGLLGGIATWYGGKINVIGVEPELCPTLHRALEAGHPIDAESSGIAADSLAPRRVGELMFPIAQKYANRVILVSDKVILNAQQVLWETLRIVAEPGGAAAFAALLSREYKPAKDERVGVVLCGANTTAVNFE
jgi:threonine dehydratase